MQDISLSTMTEKHSSRSISSSPQEVNFLSSQAPADPSFLSPKNRDFTQASTQQVLDATRSFLAHLPIPKKRCQPHNTKKQQEHKLTNRHHDTPVLPNLQPHTDEISNHSKSSRNSTNAPQQEQLPSHNMP
ncbi:hypothetical protein KC19_3G221500 [Ceratodon purpureus]|uniref:Uncharacterized protein n=1 Tax=Ceratodon purpureus TaxID=3225 RepID=A0A8T0IP53_CERPU|nr:hypothetical protein KC19_3G221500 [Ceratodon purpureus]